jgi:tetratricopeptide (TPR) repeat protein
MAEKNTETVAPNSDVVVAKAKDFWTRNGKIISGVLVAVVLLIGGYFGYKEFIQKPKEEKSVNDMFKAESYFRMDSVKLALNGDGQNPGFLRIIDKYSGTDAGNLACFYAGSCYLKLDDNQNAVKYLKKFSSDAKQIQARAYKLLGDAYADLGNHKEALDYYKKAAHHFEADENASADALFLAAYLADRVLKNQKEAIELYKELKAKFPATQQGFMADNYLAQLGVYNVN